MESMDNTGMKLKRSLCGKMEIMKEEKRKRLLISINVFGSAGAMRFVVNGDDDAAAVIDTALKMYAREGRLPVLGSDAHNFFLYPAHSEFEALSPGEKIGWGGARNFVLGKRENKPLLIRRKGSRWRAWLHKYSFSLKILSN